MSSWVCLLIGHREVLVDLRERRSLGLFSADHLILEETHLCTRCGNERKTCVRGRLG